MTFQSMTAAEIEAFAIAHSSEIGCEGLEAGDVTAALAEGRAELETRSFGFAVVEVKPGHHGAGKVPHLWMLYVAEDQRGRGAGRRFVRSLLRKYAADYHMTLSCHGARRRKFFGAVGFRVESRDGDWRRMTTNPDAGGLAR